MRRTTPGSSISALTHIGLSTNVRFLQRLVSCTASHSADLDTGLIARRMAKLFPPPEAPSFDAVALAVAAVLADEKRNLRIDASDAHSPWTHAGPGRLTGGAQRTIRFSAAEEQLEAVVHEARGGLSLSVPGNARGNSAPLRVRGTADGVEFTLDLGSHRVAGRVVRDGDVFHIGDVFHMSLPAASIRP